MWSRPWFLIPLLFAISLTGNANAIAFPLISGLTIWETPESLLLVVDESNQPIAGAQVLIGSALNEPFAQNFLVTNSQGQLTLPPAWTVPLSVTIDAPGFVRTTFADQTPLDTKYTVRRLSRRSRLNLTGVASRFGRIDGGENANVALIVPAFTWESIGSFEISSLISTETDSISTPINEIKIPSNLVVPSQSVQYGFFSIPVQKATYRLVLPDAGRFEFAAIRASFPFQIVADMLRNRFPFTEIIKQFKFNSVGIRALDVSQGAQQEIPVDEYKIIPQVHYQAPAYPDDQLMLAAYLNRTAENHLFPTDVKAIQPNEKIILNGVAGFAGYTGVIRMQKNKTGGGAAGGSRSNSISLYETPMAARSMGALDLVAIPQIANWNIHVDAPNSQGVANLSLMTQSTLQDVEEFNSGAGRILRAYPRWTIIYKGWVSDVKVPRWPTEYVPQGSQWETSFSARRNGEQHVTRNHSQSATN